jgi:nicotinamide mononucleotide adenylyltransferase
MLRLIIGIEQMTASRKTKAKPKTARERMQTHRDRLRAKGLRPVQYWVPDMRDPKVQADLRRQGKLMARPVEGGALDDWIDTAYDWSGWR